MLIIRSIEEAKTYLKQNPIPIYFVSPTNFNLIGIEKWVSQFKSISLIDCYDQENPSVFSPKISGSPVFQSSEDINEYLLTHKEVVEQFHLSPKNKVLFLFLNDAIEARCQKLGLDLCASPVSLIKQIDNKVIATQIGNEAGVPSVPNALEKVNSYQDLLKISKAHNLGQDIVVQTAYGDSGKTTFFISSEEMYGAVSDQIEAEEVVKVMKHINCANVAIEACLTSCGIAVGAPVTELVGFKELTPYKGGWCGNELYPTAFTQKTHQAIHQKTIQLGQALQKRGYKGYFELDYLIDRDTGEIYLGEINPRITGITAITNLSNFCQEVFPLFLFHLLTFLDVTLEIDIDHYNQLVLKQGTQSMFGQLIIKYCDSDLKVITEAPATGIYQIDPNGTLIFVRKSNTPRDIQSEDEIFFLRIMKDSDYAYKSGDLGVVFVHQVLKSDIQELTVFAKKCISAIQSGFKMRELTREEKVLVSRYQNPGSIKAFS